MLHFHVQMHGLSIVVYQENAFKRSKCRYKLISPENHSYPKSLYKMLYDLTLTFWFDWHVALTISLHPSLVPFCERSSPVSVKTAGWYKEFHNKLYLYSCYLKFRLHLNVKLIGQRPTMERKRSTLTHWMRKSEWIMWCFMNMRMQEILHWH